MSAQLSSDSCPVALEQRFRHITNLRYNEIQLLKTSRYHALISAIRQRYSRLITYSAAAVLILYIAGAFSVETLAVGAVLFAFALFWATPPLNRLRKLRAELQHVGVSDPEESPTDKIDAEFCDLTTLLYHERKLLKAHKYQTLVFAIRARYITVVLFAFRYVFKKLTHGWSSESYFSLALIIAMLLWVVPHSTAYVGSSAGRKATLRNGTKRDVTKAKSLQNQ